MYKQHTIAVVIPTYKVKLHIKQVVATLPEFIDYIIVVDDKCPQMSYKEVEFLKKIYIVQHKENQGVGGAVKSGYKKAMQLGADIVVKVDGDGQMEPKYIEHLIIPIISNCCDYTKGNRFKDFKALKSMPKIRLIGNSILSFLIKIASGYWKIMDPTNGFTAISSKVLRDLDFDKIDNRYFFESDMLINLNIENCVVCDISIPAKYGDEISNLNIKKVVLKFPMKIIKGFFKRIIFKYYIYNFNMVSVYLIIGFPMLVFGCLYGGFEWIKSINSGHVASAGTVMIAVLPIILGVQFLLQAINLDIENEPKRRC